MFDFLATESSAVIQIVFQVILVFLFIVIPLALFDKLKSEWKQYSRAKFFAGQSYSLLELRLPREITKSPLAMELFITSLYQSGGEASGLKVYTDGGARPWFSLEMTSVDGVVKFFIWTRSRFKDLIETQLYAQFPDIEIVEVPDYSYDVPFDTTAYDYWGCVFKKTGPSHLPIKTYQHYGLDKGDVEEQFKIDPITPIIELLGSLRKGEQIWIQIVIRAHVKDRPKPGEPKTMVDWKFEAQEDLKKRLKRDVVMDKEKPQNPNVMQLSKSEKDTVEAIENSISKIPFDVGIRTMYIARKEAYRQVVVSGITGSFRQFGASHMNSFTTDDTPKGANYKWTDPEGAKLKSSKKGLFNRYRHRAFFYDEYIPFGYGKNHFVMNTEELATIYHFPGLVSTTPSLSRITAKKSEPPANLPI